MEPRVSLKLGRAFIFDRSYQGIEQQVESACLMKAARSFQENYTRIEMLISMFIDIAYWSQEFQRFGMTSDLAVYGTLTPTPEQMQDEGLTANRNTEFGKLLDEQIKIILNDKDKASQDAWRGVVTED
jgi:hypothetical protein